MQNIKLKIRCIEHYYKNKSQKEKKMYENVTEVIRSKPSNQMQGTASKISNEHLKQRKRPFSYGCLSVIDRF